MSKKAILGKSISYYQRLGINKEIAVWEDGMRTTGGRGTYEWWYFDAEYSDGTKVVVIFYTKNGFNVSGLSNPTASIEITYPNGKTISKYISEGRGQKIRASKERCDVKIVQSSIKYSKGNYLIHFIDGDVEYTCTMANLNYQCGALEQGIGIMAKQQLVILHGLLHNHLLILVLF